MNIREKNLLDKVLKEIKQKVSEDIIVDFDDNNKKLNILSSWGSMLVDQIAPLVKGKVYELYGGYSSGKSTLAITACANVVKQGGIAAYIDAECAFNASFAETLGLDISSDNFVLLQPESEEDALSAMIKLASSEVISILVLDSTNSLVPKAEFMEEGDESTELSTQRVGLRAKILGTAVAQLVPICKRTNTSCIFISQLRDNISMFGAPQSIGSGKSLEFFASARLNIQRTGKIEGDLPDGTKGVVAIPVKVTTTKNKIIAPFKSCEIQINVEGENKGICLESEYLQVAFNLGILKKDGRGILFNIETPLYPEDTPLASSMPKLTEIFGEVKDDETHPYFWVKKEIELRVKENLGHITSDDVENELAAKYESTEKELEYAKKYFDLATTASSSSKLVEAYYYISKATKYSPFDKNISSKFKQISKRYQDKFLSFKDDDFIIMVSDVEGGKDSIQIDIKTGVICENNEENVQESAE